MTGGRVIVVLELPAGRDARSLISDLQLWLRRRSSVCELVAWREERIPRMGVVRALLRHHRERSW